MRAKEDPQLVARLAEKQIPLELCPTSNLQTKAVADLEDFPIREYLEQGLIVTVNTDNMTVSHTTIWQEFQLLRSQGLTESEYRAVLRNSAAAAFLSQQDKGKLLQAVHTLLS